MAYVEIATVLHRLGLRCAAAVARAEVSGIARYPRVNTSQVSVLTSATGDDRTPFQQVVRISQSGIYGLLMRCPWIFFAEQMKAGPYVALHVFCKVVQVSAKGYRDELEGPLIAYHDWFVGTAAAFS